MNKKMIFSMIGKMLLLESALMLLPVAVSVFYGESVISFLITMLIAIVIGSALTLVSRSGSKVIFAKEGFVIVALCWLILSLIGALPFWISGQIPSYVDAFFETVSGFTTTGASIVTDFGRFTKGMLLWRSFTHWIGGMGILVFIVAIIPSMNDRSMHILRAEMPGPIIGKLVPRARDTAKILYIIYLFLTALEIIILCIGGMSPFESVVHSFGTAGTGGFGIKPDSIGGYSPFIQWTITIFMALFGVNFNLYFLILIKKFKTAVKSAELWVYLGIIVVAFSIITLNILPIYKSFGDAARLSAFQVSSIITTTGYATTDFNLWPQLSKTIIFVLMFIGGCAGSTAGGLKVSRVILLTKELKNELRHLIHPRTVSIVKSEGKTVDKNTLSALNLYFVAYMFCLVAIFIVLSFDAFDFETNMSAAVSCFNNIGPGLAKVGPAASYSEYSAISKLVLSAAMLLGRLEIFPLLICFSPSTWTKK